MLRRALISLLAIGVLFLLLSRALGLSEGRIERAASLVAYPFLKLQKAIVSPIKKWTYSTRVKNHLLLEYEQLVQQRDELLSQVIALKGLSHDQKQSQALRLYSKRFDTPTVVAPVLLTGSQFLLLDAGTLAGIVPGMIAVHANCLVGKVTESYPLYSKVTLLTDPSCKVAIYCPSTGAEGVYHKQALEYVDHRDTVNQGDLVLSSGKGGVFPRGFCIGTIEQIDATPYRRSIFIKPCLDKPCFLCVIPKGTASLNTELQGYHTLH